MHIGPSSSTSPYLVSAEPNVRFVAITTVGDALPGDDGPFVGIPDGIGAYDNGDGTITVLVNHELGATAGVVRDHGSTGAFIDRLVIDKDTLAIVAADDLIKTVNLYNSATDSFFAGSTAFGRFCSGDLAEQSAFSWNGLGTDARIYLTGEETGAEGRAFATVATGASAGAAYELAHLGNFSYENSVANPFSQSKTIVASSDDSSPGQVYVYVGEKQATGSEVEKAGLVGGDLFGIKVSMNSADIALESAAMNGSFSLVAMGAAGDVSDMSGAQLQADSTAKGITEFLRPEDLAWDPDQPNVLYVATTASFTGPSRLYKLTFADVANPEAGGTIEAVLDGTEGQKMLDNLTVANGKVVLQEDPGNQPYLAKIWEYDIATDTLLQIGNFDPARFTAGSPGFITEDEESSGVIDVTAMLGDADTRAYLLDAQVHAPTGDPATVERGQLLAMFVDDPVRPGGQEDEARTDIDGDGRSDVLWRRTDGAIGNWFGSASGDFAINTTLTPVPTNWTVEAIGDYNGDGRDDILLRDQAGNVGNWLANADGSYAINAEFDGVPVSLGWQVIGSGDLSGDGYDDILWRHENGNVATWLGTATGNFTINGATETNTFSGWTVQGIGDFNEDGRDDVVSRDANGVLRLSSGQADGTFVHQTPFAQVEAQWQIVGVGDFSSDGNDDLLWRNVNSGVVANWTYAGGTGASAFTINAASARAAGLDWEVQAVGDYNGDGDDDILWRNLNTGQVGTWEAVENATYVVDAESIRPAGLDWQVQPSNHGFSGEWDY